MTAVCELDREVSERPGTTRAVFTDFSDLDRVLEGVALVHTPKLFIPEKQEIFVADRQAAAETEARNLIYVALTRARDRLILEWPDFALGKDTISHASLLADACGIAVGEAAIAVDGQDFRARAYAPIRRATRQSPRRFPKPRRSGSARAAPWRRCR